MRVLSVAAAALWCAAALAQSPTDVFEKAPPAIDQALRARVAIFFQAHVDGKFRQAETVVAEDSQDAFYNSEKRRYLGFEIVKIQYSDNFQKAEVITSVDMEWATARMGKLRVKPPMKTLWKIENGEWFWYVIPQKDWQTPFGKMTPGADPADGPKPQMTFPDAQTILGQVKADKSEIRLSSHEKSEDFAEITNTMPGDVELQLDSPSPAVGLTVKLDKTVIKSGETAKVIFQFEPADRSPKVTVQTSVKVVQTGATFPFRITFAVAPEHEKYLRKEAPGAAR